MAAALKINTVNCGAKGRRVIPLWLLGILKGAPEGKTFKEEMSAHKSEEIALEESKYTKSSGVRNSNLSRKKRGLGTAEL